MKNRYFLQVCRDKLTDYIMKAIICPDNLMGEECHIDTQSRYKNTLLLSNGIIKNLDDFEEVLLEIVLTDDEKSHNLKSTNVEDVYIFYLPLPISRIKKIYVQSQKEKNHILKKIDTNQKGFIPESLIEIATIKDILEIPNIIDEKLDEKLNEKLNKYNKFLGMLTYMKNVEYYYSDINKSVQNYSSDYFSILSKYNSFIKAPKSDFLDSLKSSDIAKEFVLYLTKGKRVNKSFIEKVIEKTENQNIIEKLRSLISDPLNKLDVLNSLKKEKDDIYFYICMVYINSDKYSNKLSNLKETLSTLVPYEMAQKTLAYLGYYYGYEILDANEEIIIKDKYFKKLIENNRLNTKFYMNNMLDYITIETIYQYIFKDVKALNSRFEYLDYNFDKINYTKEDEWYEKTILSQFCEIEHFKIIKRTEQEYIKYKISKYAGIITNHKYIFVFYNKYLDTKNVSLSIDKNTFLKKLSEASVLKKQEKELLSALKMDDM